LRLSDTLMLLTLAALWGASFLFLRIAAPVLGPVWLIEIRLVIAGLALVPLVMVLGLAHEARGHLKPLFILGCLNSGIPFFLITYAAIHLTAGFTSILNATTPIFGAIIAFLWSGEKLTPARIAGILLGFGGVVILVGWNGAADSGSDYLPAVIAGLLGALMYAIAAPYARKKLAGVSSLVVTTASLLSAAIFVLPFLLVTRPFSTPSPHVMLAVVILSLFSTSLAYILYYRLLKNIGALRATTVTFLIPLFAMLWGALFLDEEVSPPMVIGCGLILLGTAIANNLLRRRPAAA